MKELHQQVFEFLCDLRSKLEMRPGVGKCSLRPPNPEDTLLDFACQILRQLGLTGVATVWKIPSKLGKVHSLYVLPTMFVFPMAPHPSEPDCPDGWYVFRKDGKDVKIDLKWIERIKLDESVTIPQTPNDKEQVWQALREQEDKLIQKLGDWK